MTGRRKVWAVVAVRPAERPGTFRRTAQSIVGADGREAADPRWNRLLAGAYLTDIADSWHRPLWHPAWWFGRHRHAYPS